MSTEIECLESMLAVDAEGEHGEPPAPPIAPVFDCPNPACFARAMHVSTCPILVEWFADFGPEQSKKLLAKLAKREAEREAEREGQP